MPTSWIGILLSLVALFAWGFGDFFIQSSTRAVGVWRTILFNNLFATIVLFPFVYRDLFTLNLQNFVFLSLLSLVTVFVSVFNFTALRDGKIAVIEPLLGIELPITVGLSIFFGREVLTLLQGALIALVFIGIMFASATRLSHLHYHRRILEQGVLFAGLGAIAMGLMNFLVGVGSKTTTPLLTVWFFCAALGIISCIYVTIRKEWRVTKTALYNNWKITAKQSIVDNAAWVAYAGATTFIPTSIAATVSESYIALGVFLGIFINRERIKMHQRIGIVIAVIAVVILAGISR